MPPLRDYWPMLKQAVAAWNDDGAPSMGAALAYYTTFSLAPLLIIVIALAGLAFGEDAARGEVFAQLAGLIGPQGARAVQDLLASANSGLAARNNFRRLSEKRSFSAHRRAEPEAANRRYEAGDLDNNLA